MDHPKKVIEKKYLFPFIVITSLFALWGFANDITNPLVAAFRTIMETSNAKAALVQLAFYGGYATMAIPAALFVKKYNFKTGILIGLGLYSLGALLFYPAARLEMFNFFLISLYVLTFGLAFLETTANPYILSMGAPETATRRLNLAQSFNPMGSLLGMFVASNYILSSLQSEVRNPDNELVFHTLSAVEKAAIRTHDLAIIRNPYIVLGLFVLLLFFFILALKMPRRAKPEKEIRVSEIAGRLLRNKPYREGVVAQMFYVGVQIMCWTFIIHYAENLGIPKATAQKLNIIAMVIFLGNRFLGTFLMKYINSRKLLAFYAIGGFLTILGTIFIVGKGGLYCLVATSAFMSLMFPTIYGIALEGMGEDATLGAAGLIMAIVGGALMPPLQGAIIDWDPVSFLPAVNASFVLPLICFVVIAVYGFRAMRFEKQQFAVK
jgi:FHS family L-fucose permease-like MFS transporter